MNVPRDGASRLDIQMKRREFLAALGGAAATSMLRTLAAHAQQGMRVVGYLATGSQAAFASRVSALRQGLAENGYVEGRNVAIELRFADGRYDRLGGFAAQLVDRKVDVIVTAGPPALRAVKEATAAIPVVFVTGSDPVRDGFVASLSRPGGNLTGISFLAVDLTPKRLELLSELVPRVKNVALLANSANAAETRVVSDMQQAAERSGFLLQIVQIVNASELEAAFEAIVIRQAGAMIISPDSLFTTHSEQIVALAARHAIPAIYAFREYAAAGGLASYGPSAVAVHRQAGLYAGRIFNGDKAGDLPVMQPSTFEFVINLKTAKALGLTVPPTLLATADELIE
jgi:putative ABC transport system substrate-binding protein